MKKVSLERAIEAQGALRGVGRSGGRRRPIGEVRTTYSVASDTRRALRMLAATLDCAANDVVAIALEDFLMVHGSMPVAPTRDELRRQLAWRVELRSSKSKSVGV